MSRYQGRQSLTRPQGMRSLTPRNTDPISMFELLTPNTVLGVEALDPVLNINGNVVEPVFRYNGKDAASTWSPWGYGESLTLQAGSPTYNAGSPCMGDYDDSVKGDGTAYWQAGNSSFADIGTGDFIIELIVSTYNTNVIYAKRISSRPGLIIWFDDTNNKMVAALRDTSSTVVSLGSSNGSVYPGEWVHVLVSCDRDDSTGFRMYLNGKFAGSADPTAIGSLTNSTDRMTLLAYADGTYTTQGYLSHAMLWKGSNIIGTTAEMDAIAEERFLRLQGLWPKCKGTPAPNSWGRAYAAYTWKHDGTKRRYYLVGSNWMRLARDKDVNGDLVTGYLGEPRITNKITDSEDYMALSWTLENATDSISSDAITSPDPNRSADGIVADATDTQHGVTTSFTAASDGTYCFSVIAKAGAKTWLCLENETLTDGKVYYDLANVALGTAGADITDKNIWDLGDGWRLCWLTFSGVATTAYSLTARFADADLDDVYAGDGSTISGYLWVAQCEKNQFPTSPIITSGASATRLRDALYYDGDSVKTIMGTIAAEILLLEYDGTSSPYIFAATDGGATSNSIWLRRGSTGALQCRVYSGSVLQASLLGSIAIDDANHHKIRLTYKTDDVRIFTDEIDEKQDTSAVMPTALTTLAIGQQATTGSDPGGAIITNIRIYGRPTRKG